jgi:hypothetical protein
MNAVNRESAKGVPSRSRRLHILDKYMSDAHKSPWRATYTSREEKGLLNVTQTLKLVFFNLLVGAPDDRVE